MALSELARRGLIGRSKSAQDLHRGASSVEREINLGGAALALQVVGNTLYSAGSDNTVTLYDTTSWELTGVLEGHTDWINAMKVDAKANLLYTASDDKTVKVWDMATRECLHTLEGHDEAAISMELVDSRLLVGCTGRILVWDTSTWQLITKLSNHTQVLRSMSDGKQMSKNIEIDPRVALAREAAKLAGDEAACLFACLLHWWWWWCGGGGGRYGIGVGNVGGVSGGGVVWCGVVWCGVVVRWGDLRCWVQGVGRRFQGSGCRVQGVE